MVEVVDELFHVSDDKTIVSIRVGFATRIEKMWWSKEHRSGENTRREQQPVSDQVVLRCCKGIAGCFYTGHGLCAANWSGWM